MRRRDALAGYLFVAPQLLGIVAFVLIPLGLVGLVQPARVERARRHLRLRRRRQLPAARSPTRSCRTVLRRHRAASRPGWSCSTSAWRCCWPCCSTRSCAAPPSSARCSSRRSWCRWSPGRSSGASCCRTTAASTACSSVDRHRRPQLAARGDTPRWSSVIVVQVFKNVGLNMVLFLAALQGVPRELYEAARIDGAAAWTQFRRDHAAADQPDDPAHLDHHDRRLAAGLRADRRADPGRAGHVDDRARLLPVPAGLPVPPLRLRRDALGAAVRHRARC